MPKFHYVLAILLFIVAPGFNLIAFVKLLASDVKVGIMFLYLRFYAILTVLLILFFLVSLLDVFAQMKLENQKARRNFEIAIEKLQESEKPLETIEIDQDDEKT